MTYWLTRNGPPTSSPSPYDFDDLDDIKGSGLDDSIREEREDREDDDLTFDD